MEILQWFKLSVALTAAGLLISVSTVRFENSRGERAVIVSSGERSRREGEHRVRLIFSAEKAGGRQETTAVVGPDYNESIDWRNSTEAYYLPDPNLLGRESSFDSSGWAAAMLRNEPHKRNSRKQLENNLEEGKRARPTVLVIGSGPAGLAMLRALSKLKHGAVDFACYDRQPAAGGMWTGDRRYDGMWINGAAYYTEYPSYPYSEHYGRRIPSYFPKEIVADYVGGYTEKNKLDRYITHGVNVLSVKWDESLQQFEVKSALATLPPAGTTFDNAPKGKSSNEVKVEHFDYVTIATGSFNEPREVQTPGFTGEQLHAREWSGGKDYKGKTVVIVGGADSANDIVLLLLKYGAKRVVQSIRNIDQKGRNLVYDPESDTNVPKEILNDSWSEDFCISVKPFEFATQKDEKERKKTFCTSTKGISLRGSIDRAEGRTVYFQNGTAVHDVDAIVYATGYRSQGSYDNFVEPELRLQIGVGGGSGYPELHFPGQLHLDVLFHRNPRLFYMAHNTLIYSFLEYENKADYLVGVVTGKVPLPTQQAIAAEGRNGELREAIWEAWADTEALSQSLSDPEWCFDTNVIIAAQLWRQASYLQELGATPGAIRKGAARGAGMVRGVLEERSANVRDYERVGDRARCPCEGLAPFLEAEAAWHDIVLPASPPTGDLTRGAAAQTRYVDLKDHSIQCFLNATLCEAP